MKTHALFVRDITIKNYENLHIINKIKIHLSLHQDIITWQGYLIKTSSNISHILNRIGIDITSYWLYIAGWINSICRRISIK